MSALGSLLREIRETAASEPGVVVTGWQAGHQRLEETLFSVANGYQGVRATVDPELPTASPGTFLSGLYNRALAVPTELVKVPGWARVGVVVDDRLLRLDEVQVLRFERQLLTGAGLSRVVLRVRDALGRETEATWVLAAHRERPELGFVIGEVTPVDHDGLVGVAWGVDGRHGNQFMGGEIEEIEVHHARLVRAQVDNRLVATEWALAGSDQVVTVGATMVADLPVRRRIRRWRRLFDGVASTIEGGRSLRFAVVGWASFGPASEVDRAVAAMRTATGSSAAVQQLVRDHLAGWRRLWTRFAVEVGGDPAADQGLRFGIFHLLQQLPDPAPMSCNLASRGLTSEYHSGHFFFNSELYLLPFLLWTWPDMAAAFLRFRIERLDAARRHARSRGLAGAFFPEEADFAGDEAAAHEIRNIFTGEVAEEWSGREVMHLSADVALAIDRYLSHTGDEDLLRRGGAETLAEVARFAASVLRWDPGRQAFVSQSVMGPDEFHYHVDNDVFTNVMLAEACRLASRWLEVAARSDPGVHDRVAAAAEARRWERMAELVWAPKPRADGVIEQFDGYFDLPDKTIQATLENGLPSLDAQDRAAAELLRPFGSQLIKQADVVFLMALRPELFDDATVAANLAYYERRTAHDSSLSFYPHGLLAARLGQPEQARHALLRSCRYDLEFLPREQFANGLHLAAYAGAWLIAVTGLLGLRLERGTLALNPSLPPAWRHLRCRCTVGGWLLDITAGADGRVEVAALDGPDGAHLKVQVGGMVADVQRSRPACFPPAGDPGPPRRDHHRVSP
jgi:kojibiose phosphorylase